MGGENKVYLGCQEYSSIALLPYSLGRVSFKPELTLKGSLFREPKSLLSEARIKGGNYAH